MSVAELIIAMSMTILLIGLVIPKMDSGYIRAEWERRKFCSELRYMKRRDLAGTEELMVMSTEPGKQGYMIAYKGVVLKRVFIDDDIIINDNSNDRKIIFTINGTPKKAREIDFIYKKKIYRVTITPVSGRILFKEGIYSDDKY